MIIIYTFILSHWVIFQNNFVIGVAFEDFRVDLKFIHFRKKMFEVFFKQQQNDDKVLGLLKKWHHFFKKLNFHLLKY